MYFSISDFQEYCLDLTKSSPLNQVINYQLKIVPKYLNCLISFNLTTNLVKKQTCLYTKANTILLDANAANYIKISVLVIFELENLFITSLTIYKFLNFSIHFKKISSNLSKSRGSHCLQFHGLYLMQNKRITYEIKLDSLTD